MNASIKQTCQTCQELPGFYCHGCQTKFCSHHASQHRQSLNEQLDWFTVDHDDFLDRLNRASLIPTRTDPFKAIIDRWERDSIRDIRKVANEARQALIQARKIHLDDVKEKLHMLTARLNQAYEQNETFDERNIQQWSMKLSLLKQDFLTMPMFAVRIHGNKPVVMPIIKIQPDPYHENHLDPPQASPVGLLPIQRSSKSIQCLCNGTRQEKLPSCTASELPRDDRFHISTDHARISDQGQLIIHDATKHDASVRGLREYSQGEQKLCFRIEHISSERWLFFGIISKHASFDQHAYMTSSAYGWGGSKTMYVNGKSISSQREDDMELKEHDIVELTIDCHRRTLSLRHTTNGYWDRLSIDLSNCLFPWQLLISLRHPNDSVRILPSSAATTTKRDQDKLKKHGLGNHNDDFSRD